MSYIGEELAEVVRSLPTFRFMSSGGIYKVHAGLPLGRLGKLRVGAAIASLPALCTICEPWFPWRSRQRQRRFVAAAGQLQQNSGNGRVARE